MSTTDNSSSSLGPGAPRERSMTARVGRENQVYSTETGARLVAGAVVLDRERTKVLLISATKPGFWVLPKGGVESDETVQQTCTRELWEEAGTTARFVRFLGKLEDARPPKTWSADTVEAANQTWPPRSEFWFYEMEFEEMADQFPESHRRRRWASYAEARHEFLQHDRQELLTALEMSSISR